MPRYKSTVIRCGWTALIVGLMHFVFNSMETEKK